MNLIGIIAVSALAALFLFILVAGVAALIWLAVRIRRDLAAAQAESQRVYAETQKVIEAAHRRSAESFADALKIVQQTGADIKALLAAHQAESKSSIESAKGAFGAIRNEVKAILDGQQQAWKQTTEGHAKELQATLETHRREIAAGIDKINAEALQSAAVRATQVCIRLEKAVGVFQQLILDTEKAPGAEYGPDDFAPEENKFGAPPSGYSQSLAARMDEEADAVSQAEAFTEFPVEV